ncbi:MAG: glycerophosphodiester phosphodiesterase family protein [Patescibacteria group bacterium]|nr:glycerophosphodiester phosphodiesterase family protein [Patescibacteria group bacterium]
MHDSRVNRTTNGQGTVAKISLAELKRLDAGGGERIPTLEELFDLVNRKAIVNIELKGKNTVEPVANIISQYLQKGWSQTDFLVSSFDVNKIRAFSKTLPEIPRGMILFGLPFGLTRIPKLENLYSVDIYHRFLTRGFVQRTQNKGIKVLAWTINQPAEISRIKTLGVDGIFSNFPDRI